MGVAWRDGDRQGGARPRRRSARSKPGALLLALVAAVSISALTPADATFAQDRPGRDPHRRDREDRLQRRADRSRSALCEHLSRGRGRVEELADACHRGSGSGVALGDFNGDSFADLAIGVPSKDTPSTTAGSGAVYVIYGSANGLVPSGQSPIPATQFWSQNSAGVPGVSEAGDRFGAALAAGKFNDDDFSDLAIGVPGEDTGGIENVGRVVTIFGSVSGLTTTEASAPDPISFENLSPPSYVDDPVVEQAELGSALAWGDFDGDERGEVAVGAPGFSYRANSGRFIDEGGAFCVLEVVANRCDFFYTADAAADIEFENFDHFAEVLAAGDFDGDGRSDLAIGAPDKDSIVRVNSSPTTETRDVGLVVVFFRLDTSAGAVRLSQTDFDALLGEDDEFGASLAAGDFDDDGAVDLAIGAPRRAVGGTSSAGTVFLVSRMDEAAFRRQVLIQNNLFAGGSESGDRFGYALAAGDFDADGFADLAIGVPFEDVLSTGGEIGEPVPIRNVGEVNVRYGSSNGLAAGSDQQFRQGAGGVEGASEAEDLFGSTLTAWNFGRNHFRPTLAGPRLFRMTDLAIGVPAEDLVNPDGTRVENAGAVNVLYGTLDTGLTANGDQFFVQGNIGSFTNVSGDRFGASLY